MVSDVNNKLTLISPKTLANQDNLLKQSGMLHKWHACTCTLYMQHHIQMWCLATLPLLYNHRRWSPLAELPAASYYCRLLFSSTCFQGLGSLTTLDHTVRYYAYACNFQSLMDSLQWHLTYKHDSIVVLSMDDVLTFGVVEDRHHCTADRYNNKGFSCTWQLDTATSLADVSVGCSSHPQGEMKLWEMGSYLYRLPAERAKYSTE